MPLPLLLAAGAAGLASGTGGMLAGNQSRDNARAARNEINGVLNAVPGQVDALTGYANQQMSPYVQGAGQDMADYRSALGQDLSAFQYAPTEDFNYDLNANTQRFLDPSMDFQIKQATGAVEGSAANAGKLFSSSTAQGIADRSQEIAKQSWKDALQTALQDRQFMGSEDQRQIDNARAAQNQGANLWGMKTQGLGNLAGMGQQAVTGLTGMNLGAMQGGFETQNNGRLAQANILANRGPSGAAAFFQGVGSALPGMMSAFGKQE